MTEGEVKLLRERWHNAAEAERKAKEALISAEIEFATEQLAARGIRVGDKVVVRRAYGSFRKTLGPAFFAGVECKWGRAMAQIVKIKKDGTPSKASAGSFCPDEMEKAND